MESNDLRTVRNRCTLSVVDAEILARIRAACLTGSDDNHRWQWIISAGSRNSERAMKETGHWLTLIEITRPRHSSARPMKFDRNAGKLMDDELTRRQTRCLSHFRTAPNCRGVLRWSPRPGIFRISPRLAARHVVNDRFNSSRLMALPVPPICFIVKPDLWKPGRYYSRAASFSAFHRRASVKLRRGEFHAGCPYARNYRESLDRIFRHRSRKECGARALLPSGSTTRARLNGSGIV